MEIQSDDDICLKVLDAAVGQMSEKLLEKSPYGMSDWH